MGKPLSVGESSRSGSNGYIRPVAEPRIADLSHDVPEEDNGIELEQLRNDNCQLRALCIELEQALQEAASQPAVSDERIRDFEAVIEEKTEVIRQLHAQMEEMQGALAEAEVRANGAAQGSKSGSRRGASGPAPREEELLALSEELERERRQLQEDEQTLMEQMREMEMGMARERAEMARQRNDLQRLQAEIRHEIERLERNGAMQNKIEQLKNKLQDVTARRGARGDMGTSNGVNNPTPPPASPSTQLPAGALPKGASLMGRLFGQQGGRGS